MGASVTSTASATSLLTSATTTGSATLTASSGFFRLSAAGTYTNNTGGGLTPAIELTLGGNSIVAITQGSISSSGTARAWTFECVVFVNTGTSFRANGTFGLFTSSRRGASGAQTHNIGSGLALGLRWTNGSSSASETATLDYLTVTKMTSTIS